MFKKFSSAKLIIILAILMIIYLIVRYSGSNERNFRDKVLSFDPSTVTEILIDDPKNEGESVDLKLSGYNWTASTGGKEYASDSNIVNNMLRILSDMPTKRYAGKGKDAWIKYELTDSSAILVTLKAANKTVASLYIGKFSYNMPKDQQQQMQYRQQRGEMTSYVRLADEKDVYAVDGFLKTSFSGKIDSYRNRSLVNVSSADITRITIDDAGNNKILENQNGKWLVNGMPSDSLKTLRYMNALARLNGNKFFDEDLQQLTPGYSLRIEGNNFSPVELKAYPVADTNVAYVVTSSTNPGSYFNGKEGGLFNKIWEADFSQ